MPPHTLLLHALHPALAAARPRADPQEVRLGWGPRTGTAAVVGDAVEGAAQPLRQPPNALTASDGHCRVTRARDDALPDNLPVLLLYDDRTVGLVHSVPAWAGEPDFVSCLREVRGFLACCCAPSAPSPPVRVCL